MPGPGKLGCRLVHTSRRTQSVIPKLQRIYDVASAFRAAIERVDDRILPVGLQNFPEQCDDEACLYLATALKAQGLGDFTRAATEFMPEHITTTDGLEPFGHVWLEQDDIVVDITGDQFRPSLPPVFVAMSSEWHDALREHLFRFSGDIFTLYPPATQEELRTYQRLSESAFGV